MYAEYDDDDDDDEDNIDDDDGVLRAEQCINIIFFSSFPCKVKYVSFLLLLFLRIFL